MKTLPSPGFALLAAVSLLAGGCATTSDPTARTAAAIPEGKGRITFYRPGGVFGYAQRAEILLDGRQVGRSAPGVKFQVETTPGVHHVSVPNMMSGGEHTLEVPVQPRQTTYVKTSLGGSAFGGRTNVELVDATKGAEETADLKLVNY